MKKKMTTAFALIAGLLLVGCNPKKDDTTLSPEEQKAKFNILSANIDEQAKYKGSFTVTETQNSSSQEKLFDDTGKELVDQEYKTIKGEDYVKDPVFEGDKSIKTYDKDADTYVEKFYDLNPDGSILATDSSKYAFTENNVSYYYSIHKDSDGDYYDSFNKVSDDHIENSFYFTFKDYFDGVIKFTSLDDYKDGISFAISSIVGNDFTSTTNITQQDSDYLLTTNVKVNSVNMPDISALGIEINNVEMNLDIKYTETEIKGLKLDAAYKATNKMTVNTKIYDNTLEATSTMTLDYAKTVDNSIKLDANENAKFEIAKQGEALPLDAETHYISDQLFTLDNDEYSAFGDSLTGAEIDKLEHVNVKYYSDKEKKNEIVIGETKQKSYDQDIYISISIDDGYAFVCVHEDAFAVKNERRYEVIKVSDNPTYTYQTVVGESYVSGVAGQPFDYIKLNDVKVTDANFKLENKGIYSVLYYYRTK